MFTSTMKSITGIMLLDAQLLKLFHQYIYQLPSLVSSHLVAALFLSFYNKMGVAPTPCFPILDHEYIQGNPPYNLLLVMAHADVCAITNCLDPLHPAC